MPRLSHLKTLLSQGLSHSLDLFKLALTYATRIFALVIALNAAAYWVNPRESLLFLFWSSPNTLTALSALAASLGLLLSTRQNPPKRLPPLLAAPAILHALYDTVHVWIYAASSPKLTLHPPGYIPTSFFLALFLILPLLILRSKPSETPRSLRFKTLALAAAALILFLFPLHLVVAAGGTDYQRSADTAVVLGAKAYPNGDLSDALRDRVHTSVDLYHAGRVKRLLMTGGFSAQRTSEPKAMRAYAIRYDVPKNAILLDEEGHNTAASIRNLYQLHTKHRLGTLLVVSHDHHTMRLRLTCHRLGLQCYTVPAQQERRLRKEPYFILREVAGVLYYALTFRAHTAT